MNEFGSNLPEDSQTNHDLYVFSPTGGISLNINPRSIQVPIQSSHAKFELMGTHSLIKSNKGGNFSEYDHYIEDPTNPEIKTAILNNITCLDGKTYLKKDAIDLIYCSFEAFSDVERFNTITSHIHIGFYVNMLLMYSPELKQNSLNQYYVTLSKVLSNPLIPLDIKYLITNKSLEIEWEKCSFGKYALFKNFFSVMKNFLKSSPLFQKDTFPDEPTTEAYQDLLNKTLSGRVFAILKYMSESEDSLHLLILFKTIEWIQKLESAKLLHNFNVNYFAHRGGENKLAANFIKQMYGKAPLVMNGPQFETENGVLIEKNIIQEPKITPKEKNNVPPVNTVIPKPVVKEEKKEIDLKAKGTSASKNNKKEEQILKIAQPQKGRESPALEKPKPQIQQQQTPVQSNGKKPNVERIGKFFELLDTNLYESDFGGRINNFLRKAIKIGYVYDIADKGKIETIITKFKKNYLPGQGLDISQSYRKFCADFNIKESDKIIFTLEEEESNDFIQVTGKKPNKVVEESNASLSTQIREVQVQKVVKNNIENVDEEIPINNKQKKDKDKQNKVREIQEQLPEFLAETSAFKHKMKYEKYNKEKASKDLKEDFKQQKERKESHEEVYKKNKEKKRDRKWEERNNEFEAQKQEPSSAEHHVIYCKNVSPMAEQIKMNKKLFERATRIQDELERIINKKFPALKVIKIGSIGCGSATILTNNFNMALIRKDLKASFREFDIIEEVYKFLVENYFKEDSNSQLGVQYDKRIIQWVDNKDMTLKCSIVFDKDNSYRDLTSKIKFLISAEPAILHVFYKLQEELNSKGLLSQDGVSSYLLLIMLIASCQLDFEGKKCLPGLKENNMKPPRENIVESELLKRFTTIFQNCLQQEVSKNFYFSLLNGSLGEIAKSKSHFHNDECLVYLEDPFQPEINCTKNLNPSKAKEIVSFIENLYSTYGI